MNTIRTILAGTCCLGLLAGLSHASLIIPGDGSDGAFAPGGSIVIDLSQAVEGAWDADNTANIGLGIYDPSKWAVVFKYSSVDIPLHAVVTFINHPSRAPVVWLVSGNVTIIGTLNLDGGPGILGVDAISNPAPGPGGFRGGAAGPDGSGAGLGPGGGLPNQSGSYRAIYGNPRIMPLIGGSGAGAQGNDSSGSGGGGAILIAAADAITIGGAITAQGGTGSPDFQSDVGSGGSIKLIAEQVIGGGSLNALNNGRISIETLSVVGGLNTSPETVAVAPASPPVIWPPANAPTVRIASIDGIPAPTDPLAPMQASADVVIQNNSPVDVVIETTNFPIEGVVQLRVAQKFGTYSLLTASYTSGDLITATWTVTTTLADGFNGLQARATSP